MESNEGKVRDSSRGRKQKADIIMSLSNLVPSLEPRPETLSTTHQGRELPSAADDHSEAHAHWEMTVGPHRPATPRPADTPSGTGLCSGHRSVVSALRPISLWNNQRGRGPGWQGRPPRHCHPHPLAWVPRFQTCGLPARLRSCPFPAGLTSQQPGAHRPPPAQRRPHLYCGSDFRRGAGVQRHVGRVCAHGPPGSL